MSCQLLSKRLLQSNFSKAKHIVVLPRRIIGTDYGLQEGSASRLICNEGFHLRQPECGQIEKGCSGSVGIFKPGFLLIVLLVK